MRYLVIFAFLICHVANGNALDEKKSANYIGRGCEAILRLIESPQRRLEMLDVFGGECLGIVETWLDVSSDLESNKRFCPPNDAPVDQAIRVVLAHIKKNPQRTHESFTYLAYEALRSAWPCKR